MRERWHRYWSAPGGRLACACLRIAIASSLLWSLVRIHTHARGATTAIYHPHGIWMLYPGRPPHAVIEVLTAVAWIATIAFLVGIRARIAHAVSLVAVLALASHEVSAIARWTHQNVPPLLASIAFLGARGGDALSIDAWLRRRRGLPPLDVPGGYQWSIRLVQIAVASVFFVAACVKLAAGHGLGWALSDNLRHQLLFRFDWIHLPRTRAADWLLGAAWRYELCALANLASQLSPIAAVFCMHRPRLRLAFGLVWVTEVVGLGIVMALWDTHWLPLAAAFVDWDRVAGAPPSPPVSPRRPPRLVPVFLAVYAAQAFVLDQHLNLYPFSSYPMFGDVLAKQPYSVHQTYELVGGHVVVTGARPLAADEQAWIDHKITYRWMWRDRDPAAVRRDLAGLLADTRARWPSAGITAARLVLSVDQAPAYPAPARLDRHDLAIIGELDTGGTLRTMLGALEGRRVTAPSACESLVAFEDDQPAPIALAATRTPDGFVLAAPLAGDPVYIACTIGGERWLVAQR